MCLPVLTPMAILSKEDGGKQEMSQLLEVLHPPRTGAGNQMSLVGSRKQGHAVSLGRLRAGPGSDTWRLWAAGAHPRLPAAFYIFLGCSRTLGSLWTVRLEIWLKRCTSAEALTFLFR